MQANLRSPQLCQISDLAVRFSDFLFKREPSDKCSDFLAKLMAVLCHKCEVFPFLTLLCGSTLLHKCQNLWRLHTHSVVLMICYRDKGCAVCERGKKEMQKCNLLLLFLSLKVVTKRKIMEQPRSLCYVHGHFVKGVADIKSANLMMMS